jgi:hypothetical protein
MTKTLRINNLTFYLEAFLTDDRIVCADDGEEVEINYHFNDFENALKVAAELNCIQDAFKFRAAQVYNGAVIHAKKSLLEDPMGSGSEPKVWP